MLRYSWVDCAEDFHKWCEKNLDKSEKNILYFHNAGFDLSFLINAFILGGSPIIKDGQFYSADIYTNIKKIKINVRDSLKLLTMWLSEMPQFLGIDELEKEIYPYYLNTYENIVKNRGIVTYDKIQDIHERDHIIQKCRELDIEQEVENENGTTSLGFSLIYYSEYYCARDVEILFQGMEKLKTIVKNIVNIDLFDCLTSSSLADYYMKKNDVYDEVYELGGVVRDFIQQSIVGGWVMTQSNRMIKTNIELCDLDANSLYPTAISWLTGSYGVPKGEPKLLTPDMINQLNKSFNEEFKKLNLSALFVKV